MKVFLILIKLKSFSQRLKDITLVIVRDIVGMLVRCIKGTGKNNLTIGKIYNVESGGDGSYFYWVTDDSGYLYICNISLFEDISISRGGIIDELLK